MLPAVALLSLALAQSRALQRPECTSGYKSSTYAIAGCDCEVMLSCRNSGPTEPISMTLECENFNSNFSTIPATFTASNFTLQEFTMRSCPLPDNLANLLARFGQDGADGVYLRDIRSELKREHVMGLRARSIAVIITDYQTRVPFDVFYAVPELEKFILTHASRLRLDAYTDSGTPPPSPALKSLTLSNCGITSLPPRAFARLGNLTRLILNWNSIKSFTNESFWGLKNLEILSLTKNPLAVLPPRALAHSPRLRTLLLDQTSLAVVPSDALSGLLHLEKIVLKRGQETLKLEARALADLPALKELVFESTPLNPLPKDLLEGSTAIKELIMKDTGLESIPEGLFKTQERLQRLDLSKNKIKELHPDIFTPLKALHDLNLDSNYIEEIPGNIFSGLSKLRSVSANKNGLKRIASNAFGSGSHLECFSLSDNQLTSEALSPPHFSWDLPDLKELHLQGNRISYVVDSWRLLVNLKKLQLSRNNFTSLTGMDIFFSSRDILADFRYNHITNIYMYPAEPGPPDWEEYMTRVFVDKNPFKCDCDLYSFIEALDDLNHHYGTPLKIDPESAQCASPPALKGNLIRSLPLSSLTCELPSQDCPTNCTCSIRPANSSLEMDCEAEPSTYPDPSHHGQNTSALRLKSIQSLTLPPHVVSLNLSGIGLKEPPQLTVLQNIRELDLSGNLLTDVPVELLRSKIKLRLAGNQIECECSKWDKVYVLQKYAERIIDADNVTCSGWGSILHLDPDRLCEFRRAAILGGSLAALGLLMATAAALTYRFNLEIKLFLFSRGWCQTWVSEDDLEDAQYDAFVSFSQEDAQWVAEELLPKLEGEPNNFRLCVHYRDWVVGEMIPAQITTSVEQSRRTIVVLTENFLKSTWAPLEFRAAHIRAQRDRRARVLIVVLGEVPECEKMDAELRAYLTTNTYLKWGDPWFWKKLMYAMPHRKGQKTAN